MRGRGCLLPSEVAPRSDPRHPPQRAPREIPEARAASCKTPSLQPQQGRESVQQARRASSPHGPERGETKMTKIAKSHLAILVILLSQMKAYDFRRYAWNPPPNNGREPVADYTLRDAKLDRRERIRSRTRLQSPAFVDLASKDPDGSEQHGTSRPRARADDNTLALLDKSTDGLRQVVRLAALCWPRSCGGTTPIKSSSGSLPKNTHAANNLRSGPSCLGHRRARPRWPYSPNPVPGFSRIPARNP